MLFHLNFSTVKMHKFKTQLGYRYYHKVKLTALEISFVMFIVAFYYDWSYIAIHYIELSFCLFSDWEEIALLFFRYGHVCL